MHLRIEINQIQHIRRLTLNLNLAENKLTCIVGKNGIGKTTLFRALRNLSHSDTFVRTASRGIFAAESSITYDLDEEHIHFTYDDTINSLNCKTEISSNARGLCVTELPMPHGSRFYHFPTISDADLDIRRQIILENYSRPAELIEFLSDIYSSEKFDALVETKVGTRSYYSILLDNNRYVREDHLSSGEYFLINLYRTIKSGARLIAVDEIDLSLDAAAQVHLLRKLREFCQQYNCNVLFTTHSLAMMRMLDPRELWYMDRRETEVTIAQASYGYIKTLLFGFAGWDRYILTEDIVLHAFIEEVIKSYCKDVFYKYKIIHIGGGNNVSNLLRRNQTEGFLSAPDNVIAILDGDQRDHAYARHPKIHFLPIESVEKELFSRHTQADFPYNLPGGRKFKNGKELFNYLVEHGAVSIRQIHTYIFDQNPQAMQTFAATINAFLAKS